MSSICVIGSSLFTQDGQPKRLLNLFFQIWVGWDVDYCGNSVVRFGNKRMSTYFLQKFYLEEDWGFSWERFTCCWLLFCWHAGNLTKLAGTWIKGTDSFSEAIALFTLCLSTCRSNSDFEIRPQRGRHFSEALYVQLVELFMPGVNLACGLVLCSLCLYGHGDDCFHQVVTKHMNGSWSQAKERKD